METDRDNIENQRPAPAPESSGLEGTVEQPQSPNTQQAQRETLRETRESREKSKLKVTIKSWSGCAVWKWLANDDTCGICRVAFDGCCPDCKFAGDDCPLVWGECSHCFHIHCIEKWLTTQQTQHLCPMCRGEWKYKE